MHTSELQSKARRPFSRDTRIGGPVGSAGDEMADAVV